MKNTIYLCFLKPYWWQLEKSPNDFEWPCRIQDRLLRTNYLSTLWSIWLKSDVYFVIYSNIWQASMRGHLWWPFLEPIKFTLSEFWKRLRHAHCSVVAKDNWRMNQDVDAQEIVFLKRRLRYLWIFFHSKAKNERPIREINETFK